MRGAVIAVLAVLSGLGTANATPTPFSPTACHVLVDGGTTLVIGSGPIALADVDAPGGLVYGNVTCSIRATSSPGGTDLAAVTSSTTPAVVALLPTTLSILPYPSMLYVCSRVDVVDGPTYYWDAASSSWSTAEGSCDNFRHPPGG